MSALNVMAQVVKLVLIKTANFRPHGSATGKRQGDCRSHEDSSIRSVVIMPIHQVDAEIFHLISENFLQRCTTKSHGISKVF